MNSKRSSEAATRQSFHGAHPFPEQRTRLSFDRVFTADEYELIRKGVIPQTMDDKWFIFLEDDVLYFHRSWTGFCVYQVSIKKDGAHFQVVEALASRDSSQYSSTDDDFDLQLLSYLIDEFLLLRSPIFPF